MAKCIHPDCACVGYKEPADTKGTLLILKLGCLGCGHMSSEHRKLTSVDTLIRKEVGSAISKRCVHQIPVLDVPRSPVFGSHDPIHLPWGDFAQDCSVVCTCTGFKSSNLVTIQQSFQRVGYSKIKEELGHVPCKFCRHPLSAHKGGEPVAVSNGHSEITTLGRLKLRSFSQLKNFTTPCAFTLDHKKQRFVFVCLRSSTEIVALISNWDTRQKMIYSDVVAMDTLESIPMETAEVAVVETKTKAKRRSSGIMRRSVRLEARKIALDESLGDSTKELKPEVIVPMEGTMRFMGELGESDNWRKFGNLPEALTESTSIVCLPTRNGLMLAVSSQSGGWVGSVPEEGEVTWSTLEQNSYTCASLAESPDGVLLAMGTNRKEVIVWSVQVEKMNTSVEIMNKFQEPPSEVTIVQWSSSGRMLAVGCFHGDVLLYSYGEDELSWSQTMCVCGGSVTALTWSEDSLMLAAGGSDDCVQLILSPPPPPTASPPVNQQIPNLFNYFPRLSGPKFQHTLTLKGHQSFVADLHFTRSQLLLSLGWDGQVLVWTPSQHPHPHTVDSDPVGGFKIGPAMETKFLPLALTAVDNGLLVVIRDKFSTLSVIHYSLFVE